MKLFKITITVFCITLSFNPTITAGSYSIEGYSIIKNDTLPELSPNCPFTDNSNEDGNIVADEYELMQYCMDNRIITAEEISNTILGTWEIIGHGDGWVPLTQPCGSAEFSASEVVIEFENAYYDTVTSHTWEVVEGTNFAWIEFTPEVNIGHGFSVISSDYVYTNATISDGNMYLYQRKESTSNTKYTFKDNNDAIKVFPNPTSGQITIEFKNNYIETSNIQVYDLLGKLVSFRNTAQGDATIVLELNANLPGIYLLCLEQEGERYYQKIEKI